MTRFAAATAVSRLAEDQFSGEIQAGWDIAGNANGGYLLSLAGRALCTFAERPDPITLTAHYLRPGRPGSVTIHAERIRSGRTFTTVSGQLRDQDGKPLLALLGTFGDLSKPASDVRRLDGKPSVLPLEDCLAHEGHVPGSPGFHSNVDLRLDPRDAGFLRNAPSGEATMRGWFRLLDDEPMDAISVLTALDAFPPTIFNAKLPVAWTPTVELTAHLRARPPAGWLIAQFTNRFVSGGMLEEDGELWTPEGELIAQSRQLALVPRG